MKFRGVFLIFGCETLFSRQTFATIRPTFGSMACFLGDDRSHDGIGIVLSVPFAQPIELPQKPLVVSGTPNGKPFMAKRQTFLTKHTAIIAWVSRQGAVVIQATRDFTVKTVQKAADLAVQAGSRLYTDSASSYRAVQGYMHEFVNHTQKEYARGDVHENRAECLFSLLKPYLRVFRGISKTNLPGYIRFFQFLRNFRQRNAFEQAELILQAALDPAIASRAKKGEFVKCFDHFDLLQTAINWLFRT